MVETVCHFFHSSMETYIRPRPLEQGNPPFLRGGYINSFPLIVSSVFPKPEEPLSRLLMCARNIEIDLLPGEISPPTGLFLSLSQKLSAPLSFFSHLSVSLWSTTSPFNCTECVPFSRRYANFNSMDVKTFVSLSGMLFRNWVFS